MTDSLRVDSRRSTGADSDPPSTRLPSTGTSATAPSPAQRSAAAAARYDDAIGQAGGSGGAGGHLSVFLAYRSPVNEAQRTARVQAGLDDFRDRASGPYTAEGRTVSVPPHFAMGGGAIHPDTEKLLAVAAAAKPASLAAAVGPVQSGRGTPEQVAQLTQALIDAGKLPPALPGSKDTLVGRIHQMQWRYSIGFDCAGYTQQAVAAAAGKTRSDLFPNTLGGAISFARMQKVPVTSARAGDVLVFGPPENENVGHKMAVFGQAVVSSEQAKAELAGMGAPSDVIDSFAQGGPLHCYQLDSSWGAGKDGDIHGGYRRETALYNESTGMWAYRRSGGTTVDVGALPFQHPIDGVYRPRS